MNINGKTLIVFICLTVAFTIASVMTAGTAIFFVFILWTIICSMIVILHYDAYRGRF